MAGLFMSLSTQWSVSDYSGQRIGLNYKTIKPVAKMIGIKMSEVKFRVLQELEMALLDIETKEKKND